MTLDDDSLLSAYMDGQLGPDQQQVVESALVADPHLAETLRHLTAVRDLFAGLSRDAPIDVTAPVMRRIRLRQRLRALLAAAPPPAPSLPRWTRAVAGIGLAAAILIAMASPGLVRHRRAHEQAAGGGAAPAITRPLSSRSTTPLSHPDAPRWREPSSINSIAEIGASGMPESAGPLAGNSRDTASQDLSPPPIEQVHRYLDHPNLRHILMIADMDGTAQQKVASEVVLTTRFNYLKITIAQGIVLDPRHPDQATVYALVVNPRELDTLRQRLRVALREQVEEPPVDPGVVTQLADIPDVQTLAPAPVGDVEIPRDALAIKHPVRGGLEPPDRPTLEQYRSAPVTDLAASRPGARPPSKPVAPPLGAAAPAAPPQRLSAGTDARGPNRPPEPAGKPDQDLVVLVWVSRGRSGPGH